MYRNHRSITGCRLGEKGGAVPSVGGDWGCGGKAGDGTIGEGWVVVSSVGTVIPPMCPSSHAYPYLNGKRFARKNSTHGVEGTWGVGSHTHRIYNLF